MKWIIHFTRANLTISKDNSSNKKMVKGKRSHSTRLIAVTISLSVYDETGMHMHMRRRPILLNVFFLKWALLFWSFRQLLSIWTQIKLKRLHFNQNEKCLHSNRWCTTHPMNAAQNRLNWMEFMENENKNKKFLCLALISLNIVAREALSLDLLDWTNHYKSTAGSVQINIKSTVNIE